MGSHARVAGVTALFRDVTYLDGLFAQMRPLVLIRANESRIHLPPQIRALTVFARKLSFSHTDLVWDNSSVIYLLCDILDE